MLFDALCCFVESVECYSKTWRLDRLPGRGSCNLLEIVNILNFRVEVSSVFIETVLFFQNLSQTQECHFSFPIIFTSLQLCPEIFGTNCDIVGNASQCVQPRRSGLFSWPTTVVMLSWFIHSDTRHISWTPKVRSSESKSRNFSISALPGALLEVVFDDETGFGDLWLQNFKMADFDVFLNTHFALPKLWLWVTFDLNSGWCDTKFLHRRCCRIVRRHWRARWPSDALISWAISSYDHIKKHQVYSILRYHNSTLNSISEFTWPSTDSEIGQGCWALGRTPAIKPCEAIILAPETVVNFEAFSTESWHFMAFLEASREDISSFAAWSFPTTSRSRQFGA